MKFYEVQRALETGKKITRKTFNGKNLVKSPLMSIATFENSIAEYKFSYIDIIIADDWEIVEDILECKLFRSKEIRYTCPKCEREHEQLVYPEDRSETIHECHHCGQKFRFSNLEEMKKMYYDTESKIEDYTPILINFVKNPPDIITLNNNGSIVTYSRSNNTKGTT